MSEGSEALVRRFVSEWLNNRDAAALPEICACDYTVNWGALGEGRGWEEVERMERHALAAFPDLQVESEWMVSEGDLVIQRPRVRDTHRSRWFGVAPTGKTAEWTAMEVYRIESGKIAEQWLNEDWSSVLEQLGALPPA